MSFTSLYNEVAGTTLKREGSQLVGSCPECGDEDHLYINPENGLCDCKKCGWGGNAWKFCKANGIDKKEIRRLLESHGVNDLKNHSKPNNKPKLDGDYILRNTIQPTDAAIQEFAAAKKLNHCKSKAIDEQ